MLFSYLIKLARGGSFWGNMYAVPASPAKRLPRPSRAMHFSVTPRRTAGPRDTWSERIGHAYEPGYISFMLHPHACVFFDLVGFVFEHHEWCLEYFPVGAFEYYYCIASTSCYFIYTVPEGLLETKKIYNLNFYSGLKSGRNSKAW